MSQRREQSIKPPGRSPIRRAMRLANANAGLWAVGNGLVSTQLVVYLASDFGAGGLGIGLILAAPRFAGVMRLGVPALIARLRRRKTICIAAYMASAVALCDLPLVASDARLRALPGMAIAVLVAAWSIYHLLEYIGTVALWSWLGDLTPPRIRGRLLGNRERWLLIGRIVGMTASAGLALFWPVVWPNVARWQALAFSAFSGAVMMLVAIVPLSAMPAANRTPSATPRAPWRTLLQALIDRRYRRLLAASCWIGIVNGFTQTANEIYPIRVLNLPYGWRLALLGLMRAGQSAIAPWAGRWTDRLGNRPVMIVSQLIAATGSLFLLAARPDFVWPLLGAYVAWIAYAGLNVGLDNVKLKLAPADNNAPYLAVYHAISDLAGGLAIVAGGHLFDKLDSGGSGALQLYAQVFFWGWIARTSAIVFLVRIVEPGAQRLGRMSNGAERLKDKN
ncbi:MAG: MFS transporter [Pirellulales bacterium]